MDAVNDNVLSHVDMKVEDVVLGVNEKEVVEMKDLALRIAKGDGNQDDAMKFMGMAGMVAGGRYLKVFKKVPGLEGLLDSFGSKVDDMVETLPIKGIQKQVDMPFRKLLKFAEDHAKMSNQLDLDLQDLKRVKNPVERDLLRGRFEKNRVTLMGNTEALIMRLEEKGNSKEVLEVVSESLFKVHQSKRVVSLDKKTDKTYTNLFKRVQKLYNNL